jgi:replication-associated recombination protein RarA
LVVGDATGTGPEQADNERQENDPMSAQLALKYRPTTWAEVVAQDKAVARLSGLAKRNALAGRAYWITGASGTGKTTIAHLIAAEVADPECIEELDATTLTATDVENVERTSSVRGWGKGGRVWIINEAHGLRRGVVRQLLVMLDRIKAHVVVIFTTTNEGAAALFEGTDDADPLVSRCLPVPLARRDLAKAFAAKARAIAEAEGLAGDRTDAQWLRLVQDCGNNLRRVIQEVDAGAMA